MRKIKIKFNKDSIKNVFKSFVKYKRLFFIIFFGALLIFTFDVIYKNVYFNINYIDYVELESFENSEIKKNIILEKVIKNIDDRNRAAGKIIDKKYRDPFSYNDFENYSGSAPNYEEDDYYNSDMFPTGVSLPLRH